MNKNTNKKKIINDPVHGFIRIPNDLVFDLLEHPIFQRLRRIKQLGLTFYVYPGATHTRFQHTIGALHLMSQALAHFQQEEIPVTEKEKEAVLVAILLHDIGHGPFSHALEHSLIESISHEGLSHLLMQKLNREFEGKLDLAISIFNNKYHKKFLHQLVSSQLDMDRMDYLKRDSFYSGVVEGNIGTDRIIKMLSVVDDKLAIEAKGIYSIEKFLLARRLMYWQVYYHKTVIASEFLLVKTLKRAKYLTKKNVHIWATPALRYFLENEIQQEQLEDPNSPALNNFLELDDTDILVSAKQWSKHPDFILSHLSKSIINRILPKVQISRNQFPKALLDEIHIKTKSKFNLNDTDLGFLIAHDTISNSAYTPRADKINILYSNGEIKDIADVSDVLNISNLNESVEKHIIWYPKGIDLLTM